MRQNLEYTDNMKQGTDKLNPMLIEIYAALLATTQVSVTGADTLTSSAYGKTHLLSGTTADYTLNLPTAVTFEGQSIAFKGVPGLTKLVTLDAFSTQTIDGSLTLDMYPGRSVILASDGSNWIIQADNHRITNVAIHISVTALLTLTNQAAAEQFLANSGAGVVKFDARRYTQFRATTRHTGNGAANARLYPSYSVNGTDFLNPGTTTAGHADTIAIGSGAVANKATAWITLPTEARADIIFAVRQVGGSGGAPSPTLGNTYLEFR